MNCYSQTWVWAKSAGAVHTRCHSVSTDDNGNLFVTGLFSAPSIFGSTTLINVSVIDAFLAKYDASGNVQWAISVGGLSNGRSVSTDANGNVFVIGEFTSPTITFGSTTLSNADPLGGSADIFLAKYDASGNLQWVTSVGGINFETGNSVSTDIFGNVFVTGEFMSPTITFGSTTLSSSTLVNAFITKYDSNGNVQWAKSPVGVGGINSNNQGFSVSTDANGNVFVTGIFSSPTIIFGSTTLSNADPLGGSADIFLAKYDASGNLQWVTSVGGINSEIGNSVSTDIFGNMFVTGYFTSPTITFGSTTLGNSSSFADIFLAKYDANGNAQWAKSPAGNGGFSEGTSVSSDAFGDVFVTGNFQTPITFGTIMLTGDSISNLFIAKYDAAGNVICASVLANKAYSQSSLATDIFGNVYIGGDFTASPFIVGPYTLFPNPPSPAFSENIFVAKYTCCNNLAVTITGTDSICLGSTATLNASGGTAYLWNTATTGSTITVMPSVTTTYTVTAKDNNGCIGSTTFTIIVLPTVTASVWSNVTIFQGQSAILNASGGDTYLWSNGANGSTITVQPEATTIYCVTVTDNDNDCSDISCVTVTVNCGEMFVPNAFSPNGDGENDCFKIYYGTKNCINPFTLTIYDRWGEKVFEYNGAPLPSGGAGGVPCWDGTYKGQPMNSAVFVYYIETTLTSGEKKSMKGNISLIQ